MNYPKSCIDESTATTNVFSKSSCTIYPNPFTNEILIKTDWNSFSVKVFNQCGQEVLSFDQKNRNNPIDVSSLSKGVYFLQLQNTNTGETQIVSLIK